MSELFNRARLGLMCWKLVIWKIAVGAIIVIIGGVIASLPSQDWIDPRTLKIALFFIGIFLSTLKAVDMAFDQTISAIKGRNGNGNGNGNTEFIQKPPTP